MGIFIKPPVSLNSVLIIDLTSHNFVLISKTLKIAILSDIDKRERVKPRANGRNIVVCYMLLRVFGSCCAEFETGQTFEPTTPNISFVKWSPNRSATTLDPFAQLFQYWWGHARALHMVSKVVWVVSFLRCTAGPNIVGSCCIRLHVA